MNLKSKLKIGYQPNISFFVNLNEVKTEKVTVYFLRKLNKRLMCQAVIKNVLEIIKLSVNKLIEHNLNKLAVSFVVQID